MLHLKTKWCPRCQQTLPASSFHLSRTTASGLNSYCKGCNSAKGKEYRGGTRYCKCGAELAHNQRTCVSCVSAREKAGKARQRRSLKQRRPWVARAQKMNKRAREYGAIGRVTNEEIQQLMESPCARCKATGTIEVDHVVSLYIGGANTVANLQPLCPPCHMFKTHSSTLDFRSNYSILT